MTFSLFALILLAQTGQTSPPAGSQTTPPVAGQTAVQIPVDFSVAPTVAEADRVALTPKIDGKIEDEEWDPFTSTANAKTYLQWEPGIIYAASTGPVGQDMLVSLDLNADGWLVGDDNLEARVSCVDGKAQLTVRQLDAGNVSGPVWRDVAAMVLASECVCSTDGANMTYELRLVDPGLDLLPRNRAKINARIDLVPTGQAATQAYLPRNLASVELGTTRAAALPPGLRWGVEHANRNFAPGDSAFIRLTFNSKPTLVLKKIELRSEGTAKDATNQMTLPFPGWDTKGRAFVDYKTRIDPAAETGYKLLRGALTAGDATTAILEASYRIAPIVDFDMVRKDLKGDVHDRSIVFAYYLTSNTDRLVNGEVELSVPSPLKLVNGAAQQKFRVSEDRGRIRNTFELFVPGNSGGVYPLTFKVTANGQVKSFVRCVIVG